MSPTTYSPFFLMGLASPSAHTSRFPAADAFDAASLSSRASVASTTSLPETPKPSKRDHYRSFLSLDLAEAKSLRSLVSSAPATRSSFMSINSSIRHSTSRENLRGLPAPGPAPSSALPPLPTPKVFINTSNLPILMEDPDSPTLQRTPVQVHARKPSVASTTTRKHNLSDALACLEGRCVNERRISRVSTRRNFMSMSDGEDEADGDDEDEDEDESSDSEGSSLGDHDHSAGQPTPTQPATYGFLSSVPTSGPYTKRPNGHFSTPIASSKQPASQSVSRPVPRRRSTADSWFTSRLSNFIELGDDDTSSSVAIPAWRSFVEIMA